MTMGSRGANAAQGFQTANAGHVDVEQDNVE
jgi:hypothetical protein